MSNVDLPIENLLQWNDATAQSWRTLLHAHPEALAFACDVRGGKTAGELLQHICIVELRYAERLAGREVTPYEAIDPRDVESIFTAHDQAIALLRTLIADPATRWDEEITYDTETMGRVATVRVHVLHHALLHSIRHYAQLATLIRQNGVEPAMPMDYVFPHTRRIDAAILSVAFP